jgi:hypothetical protein
VTGRQSDRVRLLNATSSGETLRFQSPEEDFRAFDALPAVVRRQIADSNTKLAASAFTEHIAWAQRNGFGPARTMAKIVELERNEIAVFAGEYFAGTGCRYGHTAAEASIQRYGDRGPSRHAPRRYGKPVFRPRKGQRRRLP